MEAGFFPCPSGWAFLLPEGIRHIRDPWSAAGRTWDFLVLTPMGCRMLTGERVKSRVLLLPGGEQWSAFEAEIVVTYGLSPRDSLTFSGLREPVLCVQRKLPLLHGGSLEPQEFPMPGLGDAEELLPYLGARLLWTGSPYVGMGQKMRKIP